MVQLCTRGTQIENGGWGCGGVGFGWFLMGYPRLFFAAPHAHSAQCPTFDNDFQIFWNGYETVIRPKAELAAVSGGRGTVGLLQSEISNMQRSLTYAFDVW